MKLGKVKYRRKKSARVLHWNPWNHDAEPGDLMVDISGRLFRLENSSSFHKSAAGELYPRQIKPLRDGMIAEIADDEVWWVEKEANDGW